LAARIAYDAAIAAIPPTYGRRHGATLGGEYSIGSEHGTEPSVAGAAPKLEWKQIARKHQPGSIRGTQGHTWILDCADSAYGPVYREDFTEYDNYRTTVWMPAPMYNEYMTREVAALGITREKAEKWLAESRGCVGTELYEFALTA
jgi:hypothetical protein